jgi:CubicO group peptidase (beta-lactamase class C family)
MPVRFGMGYGLASDMMPLSPNPNTCFWGGWGGSLVVVDQDAKLCFAFVMNKMAGGTVGDTRSARPAHALYEALRH